MELLEKRILSEGKIKPGNILKVDSFLNHQLDPELFYEMAQDLSLLPQWSIHRKHILN